MTVHASLLIIVTALTGVVTLATVTYVVLRQYRVLKERQWRHEEAMMALKQGILPDPPEETMTSQKSGIRIEVGSNLSAELFWMRIISAFLGILGIFVGIGMLAAFRISDDFATKVLWPMGLIPTFGGVGMLVLYLIVTYGFKQGSSEQSKSDED